MNVLQIGVARNDHPGSSQWGHSLQRSSRPDYLLVIGVVSMQFGLPAVAKKLLIMQVPAVHLPPTGLVQFKLDVGVVFVKS